MYREVSFSSLATPLSPIHHASARKHAGESVSNGSFPRLSLFHWLPFMKDFPCLPFRLVTRGGGASTQDLYFTVKDGGASESVAKLP